MNKKVARLLKEYSFLNDLLERFKKDYLGDTDKIRVCHIGVAKATPDIICHIARRVGGNSYIVANEKRLKDLYGNCWEEIWAYGSGKDGDELLQGVFNPYFKLEILDFLRDFPELDFKYLIKFRYETWYRTEDKQDVLECQVYLTLYKIPEEGLAQLITSSDPAKNVYMTDRDVIESLFCDARTDYEKASEVLREFGVRFNDEVWEKGLREILDEASSATKGTYHGVTMLTIFTCGRCLINLDRGDRYVAFAAEDSKGTKMHFMGHAGSVDEIREITDSFIESWNSLTPEERVDVQKPDNKVSFLGL